MSSLQEILQAVNAVLGTSYDAPERLLPVDYALLLRSRGLLEEEEVHQMVLTGTSDSGNGASSSSSSAFLQPPSKKARVHPGSRTPSGGGGGEDASGKDNLQASDEDAQWHYIVDKLCTIYPEGTFPMLEEADDKVLHLRSFCGSFDVLEKTIQYQPTKHLVIDLRCDVLQKLHAKYKPHHTTSKTGGGGANSSTAHALGVTTRAGARLAAARGGASSNNPELSSKANTLVGAGNKARRAQPHATSTTTTTNGGTSANSANPTGTTSRLRSATLTRKQGHVDDGDATRTYGNEKTTLPSKTPVIGTKQQPIARCVHDSCPMRRDVLNGRAQVYLREVEKGVKKMQDVAHILDTARSDDEWVRRLVILFKKS